MNNNFINSFSAEWIKKRRSFSSWLVIAGGFFVPLILTVIFLVFPKQLLQLHASAHFWVAIFNKAWQFMSFMLLPMGIVLAVSLITQIEFKNNSWKQLHSTPLSYSSIYFSKLAVLLVMLLQLFVLFNIGIYLSVLLPAFIYRHIPFPTASIDAGYFLQVNLHYFVICLPMVALQYLVSLQFKNFLIPIGIGLGLVIGGLIGLSWKYSYMIPSAYAPLYYLHGKDPVPPGHDLQLWSVGYFLLFISIGLWLYVSKKEKG